MNWTNKNILSIVVGAILLLTIEACKVSSNNYKVDDIPLPKSYRTADSNSVTVDSGGLSKLTWRQFFTDTFLTKLIDTALIKNFDMRDALKNLEIANQNFKQAKAQFYPSVQANTPSFVRDYRSPNAPDGPKTMYYGDKEPPKNFYVSGQEIRTGLQASWEPDIWGRIRGQKNIALNNYLATTEANKLIQTQIISDVAQGYYTLIALDEQLKVARLNSNLSDSTLRIVRLLRQAGEETSLAIEQTQALKLVAQALIPDLEQQIALQENEIRLLTGNLPDTIYRDTMLVDSFFSASLQIVYPIDVVHNRPDVRQAEINLIKSNDSLGVAQTYRYPKVTIGGQLGWTTVLAKNWFDIPGSLFGNIIGGVTTPIFNNRRIKTNIEVAKLNRDRAEINFQKTVYSSMQEISNSIIQIQKLAQRIAIARQQVDNATLAVKHAFLLFKSGYEETNYLEVITAQQSLLNSQMSLVSLNVDYVNARIKLYRALGGGWK